MLVFEQLSCCSSPPERILKDKNRILLLHSVYTASTQMVAWYGVVTFALCQEPQWNTVQGSLSVCAHLIAPPPQPAQERHLTESIAGAWAPNRTKKEREMNTSPNQSGKAERTLGRGRRAMCSRRQNSQWVAGAFPTYSTIPEISSGFVHWNMKS